MDRDALAAGRLAFLKIASVFQGSLLLVAIIAGWYLDNPVWPQCHWSLAAVGEGVLATVPMLVLLPLVYRSRLRCLHEIRELLENTLGRSLAACGWLDLVLLSLLAGFSEEFFFRGVLEPFLARWGTIFGLITCNLIFAGCHAVTKTYAALAGLIGLYLSLTLHWTREPNLLVPVICHSLYDLVAFQVVRKSFHREHLAHATDAKAPLSERAGET